MGETFLRTPKLPSINLDDTPDTPQVKILELSWRLCQSWDVLMWRAISTQPTT